MAYTVTREQLLREALEVHAEQVTLESPLAQRIAALLSVCGGPSVSMRREHEELGLHRATGTGSSWNAPKREASEAAVKFAKSLLAQRDAGGLDAALRSAAEKIQTGGSIEPRICSNLIDALKNAPYKQREARPAAASTSESVSDGFYKLGDDFVKVQMNLSGTRMYAKIWDGESWEYVSGLLAKLTPAMKLTAEQASEFGALYGRCIVRGCKLTHEISIRLGYGPKCAENNGWPWS